jgi:hypothetical protein
MEGSDPTSSVLGKMFDFLDLLESESVTYRLSRNRPDVIMVEVFIPGEVWEVEFSEERDVEVEVFKGQGVVGEQALEELTRIIRLQR